MWVEVHRIWAFENLLSSEMLQLVERDFGGILAHYTVAAISLGQNNAGMDVTFASRLAQEIDASIDLFDSYRF